MALSANIMRSLNLPQNLAQISRNYFAVNQKISFSSSQPVSDTFQKQSWNIVQETNALIKDIYINSIDFNAFSDFLKERRIPEEDINFEQNSYKQDLEKIFANTIKDTQQISLKEVEEIYNYLNAIKNSQKNTELFLYKAILPFAITPELYYQIRQSIDKVFASENKEAFNVSLNRLENKGIVFSDEEQSLLWKHCVTINEILKQPEMLNAKNKLEQLIKNTVKDFIASSDINKSGMNESLIFPNLIKKYFLNAVNKQSDVWYAFQK